MTVAHSLILLLAVGLSVCCAAETLEERFYEQLVLRPNRDGTVTSSFAFTTLLKGGQPRDPRKLGEEDSCKLIAVFYPTLSEIYVYQRSITPCFRLRSVKSSVTTQSPSFTYLSTPENGTI